MGQEKKPWVAWKMIASKLGQVADNPLIAAPVMLGSAVALALLLTPGFEPASEPSKQEVYELSKPASQFEVRHVDWYWYGRDLEYKTTGVITFTETASGDKITVSQPFHIRHLEESNE